MSQHAYSSRPPCCPCGSFGDRDYHLCSCDGKGFRDFISIYSEFQNQMGISARLSYLQSQGPEWILFSPKNAAWNPTGLSYPSSIRETFQSFQTCMSQFFQYIKDFFSMQQFPGTFSSWPCHSACLTHPMYLPSFKPLCFDLLHSQIIIILENIDNLL